MNQDCNSFYSALRNVVADGRGDKTALIFEKEEMTFGELISAVDFTAAELSERGVSDGDRVALWSYNSLNWFVTFLSIVKIGAVAVLFNYSAQLSDLEALIKQTKVSYIAYGNNRELKADANAAFALAEKVGIEKEKLYDITDRNDIRTRSKGYPCDNAYTDLTADESKKKPAFVIFTTGTTSAPKAVMLAQYGYLQNAQGFSCISPELAEDTACIALPLFHCFGLASVLDYLLYGGTAVLLQTFKAEDVTRAVYENKTSVMIAVGTVFANLIEHSEFDKKISPFVRLCITGGGVLTQTQFLRLETSFANARFLNGYGQTETATFISMPHASDSVEKRSSTVGGTYPGKTVKIADGKGSFLKTGEIGEVVILDEGNLMLGYYGLPKEKQAIDGDGWLHTGDLGFFDEEGFLHLAGRLKDIIIRGGENISPLDIEQVLSGIDNIRDVKVMGAHHPIYGESVEACVTCFNPALFNAEALKGTLKKTLAPYKIPSHLFLYDDFPVNANNKLDVRSLKADMLTRLRKVNITEALDSGMQVLNLTLKNTAYNITPVRSMLSNLSSVIGFDEVKIRRISLAAEEFLSERILNAYSDVGDINVTVIFMSEWLRIQFSDMGELYDIYKNRETSLSAKIILKTVDSFSQMELKNGVMAYCLDFTYQGEFDMTKFLLAHDRDKQ